LIDKTEQMQVLFTTQITNQSKEAQIFQQLDLSAQWFSKLKMLSTQLVGTIKRKTFTNLILPADIGKLMKISLFDFILQN